MGGQPTKPSDVSDAAWERFQEKKLQAVKDERVELERLTKERQDALVRLIESTLDYCSVCHDVPGAMMIFPSRREKCNVARRRMVGEMLQLNTAGVAEELVARTIAKIGKI